MIQELLEPPAFKKVVMRGAFFFNRDAHVMSLKVGDGLIYEREPTNRADSNAILLRDGDGVKLCYVGREYAAEIAPWIDMGVFFVCQVDGDIVERGLYGVYNRKTCSFVPILGEALVVKEVQYVYMEDVI